VRLPFVSLYLIPFLFGHVLRGAEYTAVLLGCIPLAFASAIVRYRLMDIEVIIKKAFTIAAVGLLLTGIYVGTLLWQNFCPAPIATTAASGHSSPRSSSPSSRRGSGSRFRPASIGSITATATTTAARCSASPRI
jgi:hypothetical protein